MVNDARAEAEPAQLNPGERRKKATYCSRTNYIIWICNQSDRLQYCGDYPATEVLKSHVLHPALSSGSLKDLVQKVNPKNILQT